MPDQERVADESRELRPHLGEARRAGDAGVIDVMHGNGCRGDGFAGPHQTPKRWRGRNAPAHEPDRANFNDPAAGRIKTGGFGIEHHRIDGEQRGGIADGGHGACSRKR